MADMMYGNNPINPATLVGAGDLTDDANNVDFYGGIPSAMFNRPRQPGLYIGNLTWWTTDQDIINAINSVGVNDAQEVKFFENRNNGQSKGFCVVTFSSESSLPIVTEKLPKLELYGQKPIVTPYNRQNFTLLESQNKMSRPQINNSNNGPTPHAAGVMGISSISGVHAGTQGLPYSGLNSYNNQAGGAPGMVGPRTPYQGGNMRMQMRAPRAPGFRGSLQNAGMNNGHMIPGGGHQMNRMRFMQSQAWNNSQSAYNQANQPNRLGQNDMSNRLMGKPDDGVLGGAGGGGGQDKMSSSQSYYTPHHPSSSQSDHYRSSDHHNRGGSDLRDERVDNSSRRLDDRPSRQDDRPLRNDDRSMRHDDSRSKLDDRRKSPRREERSSRKEESSSSRRDEGSSSSSRREERSSRREKADESSSSRSSRREKRNRSDERARSRSHDRSHDKKERRERRDRY